MCYNPIIQQAKGALIDEAQRQDLSLPEKGRPLAQSRSLANMSGFIMLESGDVAAGGFGGSVNEQAAVKAYLESGCFLE